MAKETNEKEVMDKHDKTSPEVRSKMQEQMKQFEGMFHPAYNLGKCKVDCNCIEIEEFKNGGEGVKSYPCLGNRKI